MGPYLYTDHCFMESCVFRGIQFLLHFYELLNIFNFGVYCSFPVLDDGDIGGNSFAHFAATPQTAASRPEPSQVVRIDLFSLSVKPLLNSESRKLIPAFFPRHFTHCCRLIVIFLATRTTCWLFRIAHFRTVKAGWETITNLSCVR